jgi:hypothetical protein
VIDGALTAFRSNKGWADQAVVQLSDDKLHMALDANTNCIAVIMKHVAGNVLSRWTDFLTTDGEKPWRKRDDKFVDTFTSREQLLTYWESGWQRLFDALTELAPVDFAKNVTIRGEPQVVALRVDQRDGGAAAQGAADHQQARWHLAAHAVVADGRSQRGVVEGDAHDRDLRHAHD